jgi:hypothetical protein
VQLPAALTRLQLPTTDHDPFGDLLRPPRGHKCLLSGSLFSFPITPRQSEAEVSFQDPVLWRWSL